MSTPCFVANWKMNKGIAEADDYLRILEKKWPQLSGLPSRTILAPSFTALPFVSEFLKRSSLEVDLAAQNVHYEREGAYTGEISPSMLRGVGCRYVIIGHSERRRLFGETDAQIHLKLDAAVKAGLNPILCVGETLQERREGKTWAVLERQLREAFGGNFIEETGDFSGHIIAYEPVWAIGTGQTANPGDAESVHQRIKTFISEGTKRGVPHVLYGGSVTENNIEALMKEAHVDGVLVGGSSLSAESFLKIIKLGAAVKN